MDAVKIGIGFLAVVALGLAIFSIVKVEKYETKYAREDESPADLEAEFAPEINQGGPVDVNFNP